jgi:ABC-type nitrate/sulfonate/bicarbonate transport system substrate-binding protein
MKLAAARYWPARLRSRMRFASAATAAAALALAGCHAGTPSASGGDSVTVASVPSIGNASLYVALQDGLFRQAGLSVDVRSYPSVAAELAAVRSGQADVAVGDYANFFYAQEHYPRSPARPLARLRRRGCPWGLTARPTAWRPCRPPRY